MSTNFFRFVLARMNSINNVAVVCVRGLGFFCGLFMSSKSFRSHIVLRMVSVAAMHFDFVVESEKKFSHH